MAKGSRVFFTTPSRNRSGTNAFGTRLIGVTEITFFKVSPSFFEGEAMTSQGVAS